MPRKPKCPPRFNDPSAIVALDAVRFHALLEPHQEFLDRHRAVLDPDPRRIDHATVAAIAKVMGASQ